MNRSRSRESDVRQNALRERLLEQLQQLAEERNRLLEELYRHGDKERKEMEALADKYTECLKSFISRPASYEQPIVLIGSRIEVEYLEYRTTDSLIIVFPQEADPENGRISFLSPVGSQLLMAPLHAVISISTPAGSMQVRVTRIEYEAEDAPAPEQL